MGKMEKEIIRKNILDLHFQKYLVIASTSVIIAFTYAFGVIIAYMTGRIELTDYAEISFMFIISSAVIGFSSLLFFRSIYHLKIIPSIIKEL